MITVVTVEWGNYLGRGKEYIGKLRAGVARHLKAQHEFVCLHPADGLPGWFKKLVVFEPGRFSGRVLYLDLDTVIVGELDELVKHKGAVHLADWGWSRNVAFGGCWVWDAGERDHLWNDFTPEVAQQFSDDQEWMTSVGCWDRLPAELIRSYRYHCKVGPPPGCVAVAFHGQPKPHQVGGWVEQAWH